MPSLSLREELIRGYYTTTAARSIEENSGKLHYERTVDGLIGRLKPWLPKGRSARCLDLGCGCGETVYALESAGFLGVTGVDLCGEEIERARPYVRGTLICQDALEYLRSLESDSVDFITALNFLEHLSKDTLLSALKESARVLSPGGALVAMVPNAGSPFGGLTRHWDMTHEWAFVPNNFEQLAALCGFDSQVDFRECGPIPHGFVSGVRYFLWQVIRASIAARHLVEVADTKRWIYTMDMLVRLHATGSSCIGSRRQ